MFTEFAIAIFSTILSREPVYETKAICPHGGKSVAYLTFSTVGGKALQSLISKFLVPGITLQDAKTAAKRR